MFEHLLGGLFVHFNGFFQNYFCRTHQNSTETLKQGKFPKLPGAKHCENTCLVCATHWLLPKCTKASDEVIL